MVNVFNKLKFLSLAMCLLAANNAYTVGEEAYLDSPEILAAHEARFVENYSKYQKLTTDEEKAGFLGFSSAGAMKGTHKVFQNYADGITVPPMRYQQFPLINYRVFKAKNSLFLKKCLTK